MEKVWIGLGLLLMLISLPLAGCTVQTAESESLVLNHAYDEQQLTNVAETLAGYYYSSTPETVKYVDISNFPHSAYLIDNPNVSCKHLLAEQPDKYVALCKVGIEGNNTFQTYVCISFKYDAELSQASDVEVIEYDPSMV